MNRSAQGVRRVALLVAGGWALGACSGGGGAGGDAAGGAPSPELSATVAPEPDLDEFYAQDVEWGGCDDVDPPGGVTEVDEFECGTLSVPLDYADPAGGSIDLAIVRLPAAEERIGSLVLNPGGPGGSGVDFALQAEFVATPEVLGAYDLVGFDPRGVARSAPVDCLDDAGYDEFAAADPSPDDTAEFVELERLAAELAQGCADDPVAPFVDSVSVVRDMDILRAALGDAELDYLGKSYGTVLGALYAEVFPERVGRFVLDGAVDLTDRPADDPTAGLEQAAGFETALRSFVEDCLTQEDCPLSGTTDDGVGQIQGLIASLDVAPLPVEGDERTLTQGLGVTALAGPLYQVDAWPFLREAIAAAFQGDGSVLLFLNDLFQDRDEDGEYRGNLGEAIYAVNCIDGRGDPEGLAETRLEDLQEVAPQLEEASPTFGEQFVYGGVPCLSWPHAPVGWPTPVTGAGAPPILVIGTTRDPATPLVWAERLAEQLESGVLLRYDGDGHTAYKTTGAGCIDELVDAFLLDGEVPEDGTECVSTL